MIYDILNNLILIELSNVRPENIQRLLIDNGLEKKLSSKKLAAMKANGVDKLFIDSKTLETFAAVYRDRVPGEVAFEYSFILELLKMKSIKFEGQKAKSKTPGSAKFNVDVILDKINESGMASLNKEEIEFLKNN